MHPAEREIGPFLEIKAHVKLKSAGIVVRPEKLRKEGAVSKQIRRSHFGSDGSVEFVDAKLSLFHA
jgi:hypothetical protein